MTGTYLLNLGENGVKITFQSRNQRLKALPTNSSSCHCSSFSSLVFLRYAIMAGACFSFSLYSCDFQT